MTTITNTDTATIERTNKLKLTWGIICLVAPTALILLSIILSAIVQFVAGDSLSTVRTISNVILFLTGAVAVMTWLPGIIVGIILLATRRKV